MAPRHRRTQRTRAGSRFPRGALLVIALVGAIVGWWTAIQPDLLAVVPGRRLQPDNGGELVGSQRAGPLATPRARSPQPVRAVPAPPPSRAPHRRAPVQPSAGPRVAIIFDDAGATLDQLDPILTLGRPVALAVLPGLAASREVAERAAAAGLEVMLHLPLEAGEGAPPLGPGAVTTTMDTEAIRAQVLAGLDEMPRATGLNGHMGSRATADERVMTAVLQVVRERGLFFVDSRTTLHTVAMRVAHRLRVPAAERTVFLDNEDDPDYIAGQLRQLIAAARTQGEAIGIGHAQKITAQVLVALLPEFDRAGIMLVPVSTMVR